MLGEVPLLGLNVGHATLLLKAGINVKIVSGRLGHASVGIARDTYRHVMPGMQREAEVPFAALIGGAG